MTLLDFLIFNLGAARMLDCETRDVHMRSDFILSRKIIHLCTSKVVGSFVVKTSFEIAASLSALALKDRHDQKIPKRIRGSRDPGPHRKSLIDGESFRFTFVRNHQARLLACYRDQKLSAGKRIPVTKRSEGRLCSQVTSIFGPHRTTRSCPDDPIPFRMFRAF